MPLAVSTSALEARKRLANEFDGREKVDFHDPSHTVWRRVRKQSDRTNTGIVHKQVDRAVTLFARQFDRSVPRGWVGNVTDIGNQSTGRISAP